MIGSAVWPLKVAYLFNFRKPRIYFCYVNVVLGKSVTKVVFAFVKLPFNILTDSSSETLVTTSKCNFLNIVPRSRIVCIKCQVLKVSLPVIIFAVLPSRSTIILTQLLSHGILSVKEDSSVAHAGRSLSPSRTRSPSKVQL